MSQKDINVSLATPTRDAGIDCGSRSVRYNDQSHDESYENRFSNYEYNDFVIPDCKHRLRVPEHDNLPLDLIQYAKCTGEWEFDSFHDAEYRIREFPKVDMESNSIHTPCGCISMDQNVISQRLSTNVVAVSQYDYLGYGDKSTRHMYPPRDELLTTTGFVRQDWCWCAVNRGDCKFCEPLIYSLKRTQLEDDAWNVDHEMFLKCLRDNGHFDYRVYLCEGMYRDNSFYNHFVCIRYYGFNIQPHEYHILYYNSPCVSRSVSYGPYVDLRSIWPGSITNEEVSCNVECIQCPPGQEAGLIVERMLHREVMPLQLVAALTFLRSGGDITTLSPPLQYAVECELRPFAEYGPWVLPLKTLATCNVKKLPDFNRPIQRLPILVEACGDEDTSHGETSIVQDQQHNVDLAESTSVSTTYVAAADFEVIPYICDEKRTYPDLTERWVKAFNFQWTTTQGAGTILQRFNLPFDAIANVQNTPNALPWEQHAYFRCDMEVKLQINSQPGQSGYLIMGSMYDASELTSIAGRVIDAANIVQMPHVRISAGASNVGTITIPWVHEYPVAPVLNSNWSYPMYYNTVFVANYAPLRTGADGPQTVDCTVQVRFPQCEFYGQRMRVPPIAPTLVTADAWERDLTQDGDVESNPGPILAGILGAASLIGKAGAIASGVGGVASSIAHGVGSFGSAAGRIVGATEGLLRQVFPKRDCDRPQDVREPVNFYLQQNTSLSLATGVNKIKLLQLQAENTVSHPPGFVPLDDQFNNKFITSVFGQVARIQWDTSQATGTMLYDFPVSPLQDYTPASLAAGVSIPTPLGVLSSYYGAYSGNMLMRLTFAISKFHSGRVYIVYSPDRVPTANDVGALYTTLLDVQDQSVYTFVIPYQVPSPFAPIYSEPRGFNGVDSFNLPATTAALPALNYGFVRIFVENELRVMQTASSTIDIIVEIAGASNFELQLPIGSQLRSLPSAVFVQADGLEGAGAAEENKSDEQDERTKTTTTSTPLKQTAEAWAVHLNESYDVRDLVKRYIPWFNATTVNVVGVEGVASFEYLNVSVFHMPVANFFAAQAITAPAFSVYPNPTVASGNDWLPGSTLLAARERIMWGTNNTISFRVPWTSYAAVLANGVNPVLRTNALGAYCSGRVVVALDFISSSGAVSRQICSWDVQAGSAEVRPPNYRPDIVTTLHDGFRFTKADWNYQLDFVAAPRPTGNVNPILMRVHRAMGDGGNFYVFQGFPPMVGRCAVGLNAIGANPSTSSRFEEVIKHWPPAKPKYEFGFSSSGQWIRDLTKEGIEPNPGPFFHKAAGSLDDPNSAPPDSDYVSCDDFESPGEQTFSRRLVETVGHYLMTVKQYSVQQTHEWFYNFKNKIRSVLSTTQKAIKVSDFVDQIESNIVEKLDINKIISTLNKVGSVVDKVECFTDKVSSLYEDSDSVVAKVLENSVEIVALIANIYHSTGYLCLLNITALFSKLGICRIAATSIKETFQTYADGNDKIEDELTTSWVSLVVNSFLSALGLSSRIIEGRGLKKAFIDETRSFFQTGTSIKRFLQAHFDCLTRIWNWIQEKVFGGKHIPTAEDLSTEVTAWIVTVSRLCEMYNIDHVLTDPAFAARILQLNDQATAFDIKFFAGGGNLPSAYSAQKVKLQKFLDVLGKAGMLRKAKVTPYSVWLYGASGVGKSHMSNLCLVSLGEALGVRSHAPIYQRSPDVQFWNAYAQQKLISYQDFGKITVGELYTNLVNEWSSLIEPYPYNPPSAAIEDKCRLVDALAVLTTSNMAFPPLTGIGMTNPQLFYRRRHALVEVRFSPEVIETYKRDYNIDLVGTVANRKVYLPHNIRAEDRNNLGDYFYLEFGFHATGYSEVAPTQYYKIDEFLAKLVSDCKSHYQKETVALERTLNLFKRIEPESEPTGLEFRDRMYAAVGVVADGRRNSEPNLRPIPPDCDCGICDDLSPCVHFKAQRLVGLNAEPPMERILPITKEVVSLQAGSIPRPIREGLDFTMSSDEGIGFLLEDFLKPGYVKWNGVAQHCCHDEEILEHAFFEVVEGKLEVVIAYNNIPTRFLDDGSKTFVREYKARTVILPLRCAVSKFDYVRESKTRDKWTLKYADGHRAVGVSPLRPWTCKLLTQPTARYFELDQGVLKYIIGGKIESENDVYKQAEVLNALLTRDIPSASTLLTYFYYEQRGASIRELYKPMVMAATRDIIPPLTTLLLAGTAIFALFKTYQFLTKSSEILANASQSGDLLKKGKTRQPTVKFGKPSVREVRADGCEKMSILVNNFVRISRGPMTIYGLCVGHDFILLPYHVLTHAGPVKFERLVNGVHSPPLFVEGKDLQIRQLMDEDKPLDLAMIRIPMVAARNVLNYFVSEREASELRAEAIGFGPVGTNIVQFNARISPCSERFTYTNASLNKMSTNFNGFSYPLNGMNTPICGTLFMSNDMICGLHIGHRPLQGIGFLAGVSREMVRFAMRSLGATDADMKIKDNRSLATVEGSPIMDIPDDGFSFVSIGKTDNVVTYSGKTQLVKSPICGVISEPYRVPATQKLVADGIATGFDVVMEGCKKQFKPARPLEPAIVDKITEYLKEQICKVAKPDLVATPQPLTVFQAVHGLGHPLMKGMELNTSLGWPIRGSYKQGCKKKDVIKVDLDTQVVNMEEKIYEEYLVEHNKRLQGELADTVFMDFPKDELLKPGKDTRLINGAPFHHTLDMRRYLMEFFTAITKLRFKIAVGIDVHSLDWKLVHNGNNNVVDEDYSRFGPGFHSEWLTVVEEMAVYWCYEHKKVNPEYENVVRCLFRELRNAHHVAGDFIYGVMCGSPSGAYATDRINSIANLCYHLYCYYLKYNTLNGFWDGYLLVYGDDTRRDEELYTHEEFSECMKSIGITVEKDKSGRTSFLKREFINFNYKNMAVMLAPLPEPIVGDIINYLRKPYVSEVAALEETVGNYLSEIFHHGKARFEELRAKVQDILVGMNAYPDLKTFDDLFREKYLTQDGALP